MKLPEEIKDPQVWVNCSRCTAGCFSGQFGRVRACIPPDAPLPGPRALRPPLAERPAAPDPYELTKEAIRAAYIAGKNLSEISRDLTARGVPTRHGKNWCPATVRGIIVRLPRSERVKRNL